MTTCQKVHWFPYCVYFGVQRGFWWLLLKVLLPDCKSLVDPNIAAKEGDDQKKLLDEIYKFLGILDSKASALMRYNGIILAVIALMARTSNQQLPHVTYLIVLLTIGSIMACLLVVGVYWRFLEWVDPTNVNDKFSAELDLIRRVLILREACYQLAWWCSAVVLILFLVHFREFLPSSPPDLPAKVGHP